MQLKFGSTFIGGDYAHAGSLFFLPVQLGESSILDIDKIQFYYFIRNVTGK